MSSRLSKNDLLALFAEIQEEQAGLFPLSERFLKQYFKPATLAKAKEYLRDQQIGKIEAAADFSKIDAQLIGNNGSTFIQHIQIRTLSSGGHAVDAECSCKIKHKCRHIAAVLLQLKMQNSGEFGADYLVKDWFDELELLKSEKHDAHEFELLFILEPQGNGPVKLNVRLAAKAVDGDYGQGRPLSEQQWNSLVTPKGLLESDFRLFSWIRSQSPLGQLCLSHQWGRDALAQMIKTGRVFIDEDRTPITLSHGRKLSSYWEQRGDEHQLQFGFDEPVDWALIPTTPPYYLDLSGKVTGPIETPFSAQEIALLGQIPAIGEPHLDKAVARLIECFGRGAITLPQISQHSGCAAELPGIEFSLDWENAAFAGELHFIYQGRRYLPGDAPDELIRGSFEDTAVSRLHNLGFTNCKGPLQHAKFAIETPDIAHIHWVSEVVCTRLREVGWSVQVSFGAASHDLKPSRLRCIATRKGHQILLETRVVNGAQEFDYAPDLNYFEQLNQDSEGYFYCRLQDRTLVLEQAAVQFIEQIKSRSSGRGSGTLALPLSYLPLLQDSDAIELCIADPELERYGNAPVNTLSEVNIQGLKSHVVLRDYQITGFNWLRFLKEHRLGGILADDMGLGKTLQVIAFLSHLKKAGSGQLPTLILCPTSLVSNWRNEIARFSDCLKVTTLFGAQRSASFDELAGADCILTTYPLLKRDFAHYSALHFSNLILDEAQTIKNDTAQVSKLVKKLKADFKLCLSGTPVENNLTELKSLFDFCLPKLLGSTAHFKRYFQLPIERLQDKGRADELSQIVKPFVLRRNKSDVVNELPAKTEMVKLLGFAPAQKDIYQGISAQLENRFHTLYADMESGANKLAFLDALLKLRQVCCHPRLVDPSSKGESAKMQWLAEHLPGIVSQGRRVIIFSQFTSALALIAELLKELEIEYSLLTGQTRQRDNEIEAFTEGRSQVFLISLKAGGTGLNLTRADTVIHYDPWWNPAVENQATDRAYRIGQTNPVFVYKLIMAGSVEEKVYKMQMDKQALADAIFETRKVDFARFEEQQMRELLFG